LKEVLIIYTERIISVFIGFLISFLIINYFSPYYYGIYKYVISIASMFVIFLMFGFNGANVRYIPEYLVNKEYEKISFQISLFFIIQIVAISISSLAIYYLLFHNIIKLDEEISEEYVFILFFMYYLKSYFAESLLVAFSKRIILTSLRIVLYFLQLAIVYYALSLNVNINDFIYYIVTFSIIETLILIISLLSVYKNMVPTNKIKKFKIAKQLTYSFHNYGFMVVNFLRDNAATIIVVTYLFDYHEVAYYSIALILPNILRGFSPSKVFNGLIMPEFVKNYKINNDKQVVFEGLNFMSKLNLIFLIPAIIYSIFMYQVVIENFFSFEYAANTFYLSMFLFLNILLLSYLDLNILASNILEKSNLVFNLNLFSISNIVLLIALSDIGRLSIGIASLVSTFLTVLAFWIILKKHFNNRINFYFLNKHILIYFIFLLGASFGLFYVDIYIYMVGFFIVTIVSMKYLMKTDFIEIKERDFLKSKLPQKCKRWI
jgi:O-antigen/teichoic acid export membrane protein